MQSELAALALSLLLSVGCYPSSGVTDAGDAPVVDGGLAVGWQWQNPLPQGNDLGGIWAGPRGLFAVGGSGTILLSTDGGATWQQLPRVTTNDLTAIWGVQDEIWAAGDDTIIHSSDGGASWQAQWQPQSFEDVVFFAGVWGSGPDDVYVVADAFERSVEEHGVILHSTDRGASWTRWETPSTEAGLTAVWGSGATDVFAVGHDGLAEDVELVLHSSDGGASWQQLSTGMTKQQIRGVWGNGPNDVFLVGGGQGGAVILHSTDHGATWTAPTLPTSPPLNSMTAIDANRRIAVGDGGALLSSADGGTSWKSEIAPSKFSLVSVAVDSSANVIAVGPGGAVIRQTAGASWQSITTGSTAILNDVWPAGGGELFAVGTQGTVLHTTNSGSTWVTEPTGTTAALHAVWGSAANDVYAVGDKGTIVHSTDGTSWTLLSSGTQSDMLAIWGSGPEDVYATGTVVAQGQSTNTVIHSIDHGASWQTVRTVAGELLRAIWGSGPNDVYFVGFSQSAIGGLILHTGNQGRSWYTTTTGLDGGDLGDIWGNSARDLFVVGYDGSILRSSDGRNWRRYGTGLGWLLRIRGDGHGGMWIVGTQQTDVPSPYGEVLVRSTDGGETWASWTNDPTVWGLQGVAANSDGVFIVGGGGAILRHDPL